MERPCGRGGPRRRACRGLAAVLAPALAIAASGSARAQEASGYAELVAGRSDGHFEDAAGTGSDQRSRSFLQRYGLDANWRLYPNLTFLAGGLFEKNMGTTTDDDVSFETRERTLHPYVNALLRTTIFTGQVGVYRNQNDLDSGGASLRNVQDITNMTFGWRPEHLPSAVFRFIRTDTNAGNGRVLDTRDDLADLVSEYQPAETVQLYYRGALEDFDDRLQDVSVRRTTQSARVTYGDVFWDRRLQVGAEYDINVRTSDVVASGSGEVQQPLFPLAGLIAISDFPDAVTLTPAPALIDADRTASAGLNLGLQPVGGDERPRHLGLDFGGPTAVNTLYVYVDRPLPRAISDSFAWDLYTSDDNATWVLQQGIAPAPFGTFENRFEIAFAEQTARYVKVVTRPLARTVPNADQFPDILVTELVAVRRVPAAQAAGRSSLTSELGTASVRLRLLERPALYYEMSYFGRREEDAALLYTFSNGLSAAHVFNPLCSAAGRVALETGRETEGERRSWLYTASVRATPLPTLEHSLVFSGRTSDLEGRPSDANSIYLYSTAELYRGINANLGLGWTSATAEDGQHTDTTQINALATLVPHPTMTLNLLYQDNDSRREGGTLPQERRLDTRATQASVTWRPWSTLYLFASYRRERDSDSGSRFLRNTSASWSPFPDGSLQIVLRYDEAFRSSLEALSRIWSPRVRWNITDRWYAELAYEHTIFDSTLDLSERGSYTASTRIWF